MNIDRKEAKRAHKMKQLIEQQRLRMEDVSEEDELDNAELMEDGEKHGKVKEGLDVESSGDDSSDAGVFVNPLTKGKVDKSKQQTEESEEWSDDESIDLGLDQRGKKKAKKNQTLLGKRKRKGEVDDIKDFFTNEGIEEVPLDDPDTKQQ